MEKRKKKDREACITPSKREKKKNRKQRNDQHKLKGKLIRKELKKEEWINKQTKK